MADNADKYERVFCLLNNEESVIVISDNVYMDEMQKIGKDMIQNEKQWCSGICLMKNICFVF